MTTLNSSGLPGIRVIDPLAADFGPQPVKPKRERKPKSSTTTTTPQVLSAPPVPQAEPLPAAKPGTETYLRVWGAGYAASLMHDAFELAGIESFLRKVGPLNFGKFERYTRSQYSMLCTQERFAKADRDFERVRKIEPLKILDRRIFQGGCLADDIVFVVAFCKQVSLDEARRILRAECDRRSSRRDEIIAGLQGALLAAKANGESTLSEAEIALLTPEALLAQYDAQHAAGVFREAERLRWETRGTAAAAAPTQEEA